MIPRRDRADELRALPDLWPEIRREIGAAIVDALRVVDEHVWFVGLDELEEKYRKGEAEHDRDWLGMSRAGLEREIRAEVIDLVLYLAMIRARWVDDVPTFVSNRDPGDEQDSTD